MNDSTVYVGLDTHKDSNVAAYSIGLGGVQSLGNVGVREHDLDRLCTRLQSKGSRVCFVYEAGPCGYGLYGYLTGKGFACMVCGRCQHRWPFFHAAEANGSGVASAG